MAIETKTIIKKLEELKSEVDYIKGNMVDKDMFLTPEEETRLEESLKEYNEGKATPLEEFEKETK